jgi:polysaccharide biosynthesis protein PslH
MPFFPLPRMRRFAGLPLALWNGLPFTVKYFYSAMLAERIRQTIFEINPDHIFCQLIRMAPYVRSLPFPKTIDYMDAFSLGFKRRATFSPFWLKPLISLEANLLRSYESRVYKDFDSHCIISVQDRDHLSILSKEKIAIVKNGVDHNFFIPNPGIPKSTILFSAETWDTIQT